MKRSALEGRRLQERLRTQRGMGDLVGTSPAMEKMYSLLSKVVPSTHAVLILGESGTGKELVARLIHSSGPNASMPFITVDCKSLAPALIESEFFGHAKGASTGANRPRKGLLAAALGGTVFLDEVGELPMDFQAKLLRALQEKEVRPVGATHTVSICARVLAATNGDLNTLVTQGRFRKDLYYRLNVVTLRVPPLRERRQDIALLTQCFLEGARSKSGKPPRFSDDALQLLMKYDWPENVRELQHTIEHVCAMSPGPVLHIADLPAQLQDLPSDQWKNGAANQSDNGASNGHKRNAIVAIAEVEKHAILGAMRRLNGDKLMAARLLGIGKTTLYRKLQEYERTGRP